MVDVLVYGLSAMALFGLVKLAGREGMERILSPDWAFLLGALAITYLFTESMTLRYAAILRFLHGERIPSHLPLLYGTVVGMTAGLVVPREMAQLVGKPALLKDQEGFPMSCGVYGAVLERVMDLGTGLVLGIPFLVKILMDQEPFRGFFVMVFAVVLVGWAAVIICNFTPLLRRLDALFQFFARAVARLSWIPTARVQRWLERGRGDLMLPEGPRRGEAAFVLWTMNKTIMMSLRLLMLSLAFSVPIPLEDLLLGIAAVQLSLVLSFTPGAIGFLEAGWYAALSLQGVPHGATLTLLLGLRASNYLFFPVLTLVVWAVYRVRRKKGAGARMVNRTEDSCRA
jgi:uncharacterized protein (TIRG00374 family)